MHVTSSALVLILITLVAGTVNGALGYGFSSITVPVALLFYANRVLNPALVWIEVVLNAYVLWVNRASVPHVWRRVVPMIVGLALDAALGTAVMLSNQGFTKQDFRAELGLVRLAESTFTAVAYYFAGMFSIESAGLLPYILPSLVVGIPLGVRVIRHVRPETFRRVCMSFDAWVVGYGISTLLRQLHLIETNAAFSVLAAVGLIDIWLLFRFFRHQTLETVPAGAQPAPAT